MQIGSLCSPQITLCSLSACRCATTSSHCFEWNLGWFMIPGTQNVEVLCLPPPLYSPLTPPTPKSICFFFADQIFQGAPPRIIGCCVSCNAFTDIIGILHNQRNQSKLRVNFLTSGIGRVLMLIRCVTPHKYFIWKPQAKFGEPQANFFISIKKCPNEVQWRS